MLGSSPNLMVVAVGNTTVSFGFFEGSNLRESGRVPVRPIEAAAEAVADFRSRVGAEVAVIGSVNGAAAERIECALREAGAEVGRVGRDVPISIRHTLEDASTLGEDRKLCAIAAFRQVRQACVVIDAGTAVTVDFVDGEGTFHGGAIGPGIGMMLRALHEQTASLPELRSDAPLPTEAFGKDTRQAMTLGVHSAVRGMAYRLIEQYAERYGAFPMVIATGGDAARLFSGDGIVDRIVPDLQLYGIRAVCEMASSEPEG